MNRAGLEHILRAGAAVSNEREIVVIGSQAVLGQFPDAPEALLTTTRQGQPAGVSKSMTWPSRSSWPGGQRI